MDMCWNCDKREAVHDGYCTECNTEREHREYVRHVYAPYYWRLGTKWTLTRN